LKFKYSYILLLVFLSAAAHAETSSLSEEDILFEKVYNDPGNIKLNFELARLQLKVGNIKGAAATLERILARFENETTAQLLLARINRQLGNPTEANRLYQAIINNTNAPETNINQARQELASAKSPEDLWSFSGYVSMGGGLKSDARGVSDHNQVLLQDVIYQTTTNSKSEKYRLATASFNAVRKLDPESNNNLIANLTVTDRTYDFYPEGKTTSYNASLALDLQTLGGFNTYTVNAGQLFVASQPYIDYYGASINHRHILAPNLIINVGGSATRQEFQDYPGIDQNQDKSNWTISENIGLTKSFERVRLDATLINSDILANQDWYGYHSMQANFAVTTNYLLGLTSINKSVTRNLYDAADTYVSNSIRRDLINTYGARWSIGLESWDTPRNNEITASVDYKHNTYFSNIQNYQRTNDEDISISLSKNF
jgi:tetratricopeptide (TPR) repeat protein